MKCYIINNPFQKGAVDGVMAICLSLQKLIEDFEYRLIDDIKEVNEQPDIVWTVGPDCTEKGLEIIDTFNPRFVFGMKDPFKNATSEAYDIYHKIVDTMGTMRNSEIVKARPELVYFPNFPPFTLSAEKLKEAAKHIILDVFAPDLLISIGGADPYTKKDLTIQDMDNLIWMAKDFSKNIGGKVVFATSPRTSKELIVYLKSKLEDNYALHDYHSKTLFTKDNSIECENIFFSFIASADYIVQTDDSLSMMSELTIAEKHLIIYQTVSSNFDDTPQRLIVANNIERFSGAVSYNTSYVANYESVFTSSIPKTTSLEGVIDKKIALQILKTISMEKLREITSGYDYIILPESSGYAVVALAIAKKMNMSIIPDKNGDMEIFNRMETLAINQGIRFNRAYNLPGLNIIPFAKGYKDCPWDEIFGSEGKANKISSEKPNVFLVPSKSQSDRSTGLSAKEQSLGIKFFEDMLLNEKLSFTYGSHVIDDAELENMVSYNNITIPYMENEVKKGFRGDFNDYIAPLQEADIVVGIASVPSWISILMFPEKPHILFYKNRKDGSSQKWKDIEKVMPNLHCFPHGEDVDMKRLRNEVKELVSSF